MGKDIIIIIHYALMIFVLLSGEYTSHAESSSPAAKFNVGVIVDEGTMKGKVVRSSVTMAVSDFHEFSPSTRIHLHFRDSQGDPFLALTAAQDLLENIKAQAIFTMPEMSSEATLLGMLGDKAKVPIFSFSSPPSSTEHPYLIQMSEDDEDTGLKGVTAFVAVVKWKNVVLIHDQSGNGMKGLSYLLNNFQEIDLRVAHMSTISPSSKDHQISEELNKLKRMHTSIFIVHVSASLAPRLFGSAKALGMMKAGYAWIVTDKTMDLFHRFDTEAIESMQGAVGFKSYAPESHKLQNLTLRWNREFQLQDSKMEAAREFKMFGMKAYDAAWALAKAIESAPQTEGIKDSANFSDSLVNGKLVSKTYEVVNVIGTGERRVGFWTVDYGFSINAPFDKLNGFTKKILDSIIWPGPSATIPKGWLIKKLRIGVPVKKGFKEFIEVSHDIHTNKTTATGLCVDVFDAAIGSLGYEVTYEFVRFVVSDDNEPSQGNYNDLIHQIYLQNFDGVVGDTTFTSNRSLYVDFTLPYTDPGVGTVARLGNIGTWFFLKPFDTDLWIMTAISFIITGFTIWLIEHERNEEFQGSPAQQIGTIFWFTTSTLVYAQRERLLSHLSRFVLCIWMLIVFIISSTYSAALSSFLTLEQIRLAKGDYIGYRSFSQEIIFNNTNFADSKLIVYKSREEYCEALSKGTIGGIIDEIPYITSFLAKYPSEYALIKTASTTNGFSFAFEKGSPLVGEISRAIARLREEGKLKELENKWFNKDESLLPQGNEGPKSRTLNLGSFRSLFLVSWISKAIAVSVFLFYILHKKLCIFHYMLRIASGGELALMIRCLLIRKSNTINGVNETSHV